MTDSTPIPSHDSTQPDPAAAAAAAASSPASATPPAEIKPPDAAAPKPAESSKPETPPIKSEAKPPEAAKPPADAIPETYEIKPPEGVTLDAGLITALTPAFKAAGLTTAKAQKLAETFIAYQGDAAKRAMQSELDRTMKDPEIGQLNWGTTIGQVNRALAAFTTAEDRKWMEQVAGVGNRLEFVRLFARIGRAMAEDRPARGSPTSAEKATTATKLYGGGDRVGNEKQ